MMSGASPTPVGSERASASTATSSAPFRPRLRQTEAMFLLRHSEVLALRSTNVPPPAPGEKVHEPRGRHPVPQAREPRLPHPVRRWPHRVAPRHQELDAAGLAAAYAHGAPLEPRVCFLCVVLFIGASCCRPRDDIAALRPLQRENVLQPRGGFP